MEFEINKIFNMDCMKYMETCPENSIDLIVADFPYKDCINIEWDKAWANIDEYISLSKVTFTFILDSF